MEAAVRRLLEGLGECPDREGLKDTPERVVKAWEELTSGYQEDSAQVIGRALFNEPKISSDSGSGVVCVRDINFASISVENLMPYYGRCHIAYAPRKDAVLGLSKFARLVQVFSKRIQSQQMLTNMLAQAVTRETRPNGVAVMIEAQHLGFRLSMQPPVVTFARDGVFKMPGTAQEELRTALLLNDLGSMECLLENVQHQMSESTTLQHDVIVASEGRDAYLAMKSLLVSLGVYNVVEGIESGLRAYIDELLHATSGYGPVLTSVSQSEDGSDTLHEDFPGGMDHGEFGFVSSASGQEDETEASSGTEEPSSHQFSSSLVSRSSENLSELASEHGDCCVQDIRWRLSDVVWPPTINDEKYFEEECFRFQSTCEHHLLPFSGHVYIGYIPRQGQRKLDSRVLGKIVSKFCLRLQLQERITHQITDSIQKMIDPVGSVVVARANHMCMVARGVQSHSSTTVNSVVRGENTSFLLNKAVVALDNYHPTR